MLLLNTDKWINYIHNHKVKSFWIAFLLTVGTTLCMRPSSSCLITSSTPLAIVDLELAFDQQEALRIKEVWIMNDCSNALSFSANGLEAAVVNIWLDFPFLISYTIFLIVLIVITQKGTLSSESITIVLIYAALLAGLLDGVENFMMMIFLKWYPIPSYTFAVPASIKFGIVAMLIVIVGFRLIGLLLKRKV